MILCILAGLLTDWKIDTAAWYHEFPLTYWKNKGPCSALTWFYHSSLCPLSVPVCHAHQHSAKMFLHRHGQMVFFSDPEICFVRATFFEVCMTKKNKTNKIPWWHWEIDSLFYHLFGAVGRKVAWGCGAWGLIRIRRLPWGRTQLRRPLYDATSIHLQRSGKKSGKHKTLADQSPLPDYGNGTHAACDVGIHRNMIYKSSSRFPCYTFTKTLLYIYVYIYTIPANSSTTKMYNSKDKNVYTVHTYI